MSSADKRNILLTPEWDDMLRPKPLPDPQHSQDDGPEYRRFAPAGCPDHDFCRGNRTCYWDCGAYDDMDAA